MTSTQNPTPRIPSIGDLISLELPRLKRVDGGFTLSCSQAEIDRLKKSARNAGDFLNETVKAVGKLVAHVGMYEPEEFDHCSLSHVGSLLEELALCRERVDEIAHILSRAKPAAGGCA
jgi:hypothetical protein